MNLHSLLDHYSTESEIVKQISVGPEDPASKFHIPSNGFIKASLAIVAEAPLRATPALLVSLHSQPFQRGPTSSERVMSVIDITTSHFFDDFVCSKVYRVGRAYPQISCLIPNISSKHSRRRKRTSSDNHARNALPQGANSLNPRDCRDRVGQSGVQAAARGVQDLHAGLK